MKKVLNLLLITTISLCISCSKDDSTYDDGAYNGTYTLVNAVDGGKIYEDMSLYINIKNKIATVTMKSISLHDDMTPIDIVLPNIPYDESYSADGKYGFSADTITAQSTSGESFGSNRAIITNVIVQTDYKDAYLRFACKVEGYGQYILTFTTASN